MYVAHNFLSVGISKTRFRDLPAPGETVSVRPANTSLNSDLGTARTAWRVSVNAVRMSPGRDSPLDRAKRASKNQRARSRDGEAAREPTRAGRTPRLPPRLPIPVTGHATRASCLNACLIRAGIYYNHHGICCQDRLAVPHRTNQYRKPCAWSCHIMPSEESSSHAMGGKTLGYT